MKEGKKYSDKKLKMFGKILKKKLAKVDKELNTLKALRKDQKKYITQNKLAFNDDTRRFHNRAILDTMITRFKKKNKKIRAALSRIEKGSYGICKKTGTRISEKRLKALPTARLSMKAKLK